MAGNLCSELERILPLVERPARYLGDEIHCIRKDPAEVGVSFALAFPDIYEMGMSHLGVGILYSLLNAEIGIQAERVFAPWKDMEGRLREAGLPLTSLETHKPLSSFDIVGFSLNYELAATNMLLMLDLGRIPLLSVERSGPDPIVVAGGPCTANPAPFAPFVDAFAIGDGERTAIEIARRVAACKRDGSDRASVLRSLAEIESVYVPSLPGATARRAIVEDLDEIALPTRLPIPWVRPVHDRVAIEVARGCAAGCRFCQAGMIYRPVRERSPEKLLAWTERALAESGSDVIGLLSLSTGDYSSACALTTELGRRYASRGVSVSLPSLRVGSLRPELVAGLAEGRRTGFTIAPEAGTDRLRKIINKPMTDEAIVAAARSVLESGWSSIKLYYMIGLPGEQDEDIRGLIAMSRKVAGLARGLRGDRKVVVNVSTFVPKAHTPFQWEAQASQDRIHEIQGHLKGALRGRSLELRWHDPRLSELEAVIARGDSSIGPVILEAYRRGARFDAWADSFEERAWREAFSAAGIDPVERAGRRLGPADPLPWDPIDTRVSREFLIRERERALQGETLADCRGGGCPGACGTCDFEDVKTVVRQPLQVQSPASGAPVAGSSGAALGGATRYRIWYRKTGGLRFLGHLDLVSVLTRAIRRAALPVRLSEGFHPMPRIRFGPALALGIESLCEFLDVDLASDLAPDAVRERLNTCLPHDLAVESVSRLDARAPSPERSLTLVLYRLQPNGASPPDEREAPIQLDEPIARALSSKELFIAREGKSPLDIRPFLANARPTLAGEVDLSLRFVEGRSPRPVDAMEGILGLPSGSLRGWRTIKIAAETIA